MKSGTPKPSGEFFQTLGQYVYKYVNDNGRIIYCGKGNGDRCLAHLKDKDYSIENCYIIARNLEKFSGKKDGESFLLESYIIATETPEDNSVSGHYKECFIMKPLSQMFTDFQSEQHDNFETLPQWYLDNYPSFFGKLREIKINSGATFFLSSARNNMYIMWKWVPNSEDPINVQFEINAQDDKLTSMKKQMKEWLKDGGYVKVSDKSKDNKMSVDVETIEEVIQLFELFWQ